MKCNKCGAEVGENNIFCLSCGAKLDAAPGAPAGGFAAMEQTAPAAPAAPAAAPAAASPMAGRDPYGAPPQPGQQPPLAAGPAMPPVRPVQQQPFFDENLAPRVSVGSWLGTLLLLMFIPLTLAVITGVVSSYIGAEHIVTLILSMVSGLSSLILIFIFAFSGRVNPSKRNFFRATLIITLIMLVLIAAAAYILIAMFPALLEELTAASGLNRLPLDLPF